MDQGSKYRIIDVENLGRAALIVNTSDTKLLLLDKDLTCEERMQIMTRLLPPAVA